MSERVLVVAAPPDDEVLGCEGTMARHTEVGDSVDVLLLADGISSRGSETGLERRSEAARKAADVLGANPPLLLGMPDNIMDTLPLLEVAQEIETVMKKIRPTIVYTHHGRDLNVDHQITHRAVLTACRPLPGHELHAIFTFETLSSTEWGAMSQCEQFCPVYFVDVASTLARKITALQCYDEEMRPFPHARSYEGVTSLARLRGGQNGLAAAEAFGIVRQFWR